MNGETYMKKLFIVLFLFLTLQLFSGCSSAGTFDGKSTNSKDKTLSLKDQPVSLNNEKQALEKEFLSYKEQAENTISILESKISMYESDAGKKKKGNTTISDDNRVVVGDIITIEDYCELKFEDSYFNSDLNPSNTSSAYTYFKGSGPDFKYAIIKGTFKNLNNSQLEAETVIQSVKAIYNNKYEYNGYAANEDADKSGFWGSVSPLMNSFFYIYVEVPKEVQSSDLPLEIQFVINEDKYSMVLK